MKDQESEAGGGIFLSTFIKTVPEICFNLKVGFYLRDLGVESPYLLSFLRRYRVRFKSLSSDLTTLILS